MLPPTKSANKKHDFDPRKFLATIGEGSRNSFAHYRPCLWSIELHDMPQMVIDGLEITRFLGLESGNYTWLTDEARQRINGLVAEGVQVLQQSCLFREIHSPD